MNAPSIDIELSGGYYLNSINRLISDLAPLLDLGRGITASLGDNPAYSGRTPDDAEAISFALEPTVTATPERNQRVRPGVHGEAAAPERRLDACSIRARTRAAGLEARD